MNRLKLADGSDRRRRNHPLFGNFVLDAGLNEIKQVLNESRHAESCLLCPAFRLRFSIREATA